MTPEEAAKDGVIFEPFSKGGRGSYLIPCEECGVEKIRRTQYSRKRRYVCDYCKGLIKRKEKISKLKELEDIETKAEKRFKNAVGNIEKQVKDFSKYSKPIEIAKTRAELYASIPEAMVAIELLKLGYKIIPQQKIGKYKVDFAIPKQKLVIEVDGSIYHRDVYKGDREAMIQLSLGLDWKIIHIPAEGIAKDVTKLKKAIDVFVK